MLPNIDKFILCLEEYKFLEVFDQWETYLCSNFPYNFTWDIDIIFIGEPSEELGEKILDFQKYVKDKYDMKIDEQVYENTQMFKHIVNYNSTGDMLFDGSLLKFKTVKHEHRNPIYYNKYFWKYVLKDMSVKNKFKAGKANMHYPILIEDFIQLVFNIKNPDVYNTEQCKTFNKYKKLDKEWKDHIRR